MKKSYAFASILLSAVLFSGISAPCCAAVETEEGPEPSVRIEGGGFTLRTGSHEKYLDGAADGSFQPAQPLTRAQAAALLYGLSEAPPLSFTVFPDVPVNAWYAQAAGAVADAGLIACDETGAFRPDGPLTRKECAVLLAAFLPAPEIFYDLPDVAIDDPADEAVCAVIQYGLLSCDETGAFRPDGPLTRAEAAVAFNRLLGRSPNPSAIASAARMRVFPDVPKDHWAYAQIIEATTTHECMALENNPYEVWSSFVDESPKIADGFHSVDGWLYYALGGQYVASQTVGTLAFDANGRYTSGDTALDAKLAEIVRAQTTDAMSRDEKLRALYDYVSRNFTYIKRDLVAKDAAGWQTAYAASFFADGRGNCFSFAAAFQQLARAVGVEAETVVGNLGGNRQDHGWVEIVLDGATYVFDPELEMVYRGRGRGYDLFKFEYATAPFTYWK